MDGSGAMTRDSAWGPRWVSVAREDTQATIGGIPITEPSRTAHRQEDRTRGRSPRAEGMGEREGTSGSRGVLGGNENV